MAFWNFELAEKTWVKILYVVFVLSMLGLGMLALHNGNYIAAGCCGIMVVIVPAVLFWEKDDHRRY